MSKRWAGVICQEGIVTGDGRHIELGALTWETPIPLRVVLSDIGAHDGALTAGRILAIERKDDGTIWAEGDFDDSSEAGKEAYRLVSGDLMNGVSVDLDSVSFEVRALAEIVEEMDQQIAQIVEDQEDGDYSPPEREKASDGRIILEKYNSDDYLQVITASRIRAATLVSIPAFAGAKIYASEDDSVELEDADVIEMTSMVAAAAPVSPPKAWFSDPQLSAPTPLTVQDDGRIFGHLAAWGTCHIGNPEGPGICTQPPSSYRNYSDFHTGAIVVDSGETLSVGRITLGTGHAAGQLNARSAAAHYDNTGAAVADVAAGEDAHGIWVAGALRPGVTAEQIRTLRASPLSGDWRYVGGSLELVAALAVNVAGFPIPRPAGLVASGELTSLVASGLVPNSRLPRETVENMEPDDLRYLKQLIAGNRESAQNATAEELIKRMTTVRAQRLADSLKVKVDA